MRALASVADPSRGTLVAIGFPLFTLVAATLCLTVTSPAPGGASPILLLALLLAPAAAERVAIQLGPRSWYTACTPTVVLAGLVGGPAIGLAAGVTSQMARTDAVWRRRAAEGGIASLQGLAAGLLGLATWTGNAEATMLVLAASTAAVAINTVGRALIMVERRARPFWALWTRGIVIDIGEAVVAAPLVAVLLTTSAESSALVVSVLASALLVLTVAQRLRRSAASELAAEQAIARRDQLTGAPNRRAFEEALAAEHSRIVRGGQPAGLFVVDIDRFKSINDRFGHDVGDEVLIEVVARLSEGLRPSDVVARWGGEEITVLAPGVRTRRSLEQFGERVRLLIGDLPLATRTTALPVTVSVGGTFLDGAVTPAAAMRRADGALYEAKRTRDASVVSLPPRLNLRLEAAS